VEFETKCVHSDLQGKDPWDPVVAPIYLSTVFSYSSGVKFTDRGTELKYSREDNPTVRYLEAVLTKLELGGDALATSSGLSAILTVLLYSLSRGSILLTTTELYGGTRSLIKFLSNLIGFKVITVSPETNELINALLRWKPTLVLIESVTNPNVRVINVKEVCGVANDVGVRVVVDNTIATPVLLNPLKLGSYLVIHSLSKYIGGHNDVIGGAVIGGRKVISELWVVRKLLGCILSPFNAYLVVRGVKTLSLRFRKASENALAIAEFLEDHPRVNDVRYPGLSSSPYKSVADELFNIKGVYGALLSFEVKGGKEEALKVLKKVKLIKASTSFGGTESLISYPLLGAFKDMPKEVRDELGISEGLLRLSVGIEDVNDLIEDLSNALS